MTASVVFGTNPALAQVVCEALRLQADASASDENEMEEKENERC